MRKFILIVAPFLIVLLSGAAAVTLVKSRPEIERKTPVPPPPLVRTLVATPEDVQVFVESQGTVEPRTETALVSEVAGRVVDVSPSFAAGGVFQKGDVLLRLDSGDYELAVVQARSLVAQTELRLAQEEAEAAIARKEWSELQGGEAPPLANRDLQVAQARAGFEAAKASQRQAERNLERTRIRAPYSGRVRATRVDVGQYVGPGTPVAEVFATDYAEIRLPVRDSEFAFLDVPLDGNGNGHGPSVVLRGDFAGEEQTWQGRIVRTEGEIDPRTRMIHLVARVDEPYAGRSSGRSAGQSAVPLSVGLFVSADVAGTVLDDVFVIPRSAIRKGGELLIVDDEDRLRIREVQVVRAERERVIVSGGIAEGERICLSPLEVVTDGMKVRTGAGSPKEMSSLEEGVPAATQQPGGDA
ncbi:MAG: efflux RND transporter periplasmic adaptor subunit [Candidatus Eisenbacteria bacterium]